jgi:hypothetical protein
MTQVCEACVFTATATFLLKGGKNSLVDFIPNRV